MNLSARKKREIKLCLPALQKNCCTFIQTTKSKLHYCGMKHSLLFFRQRTFNCIFAGINTKKGEVICVKKNFSNDFQFPDKSFKVLTTVNRSNNHRNEMLV